MRLFGRLLAAFLVVPFVDLFLLIQIGSRVGFWPTVGLVVLTGVAGSYLAKREGLAVWHRFNDTLRGGSLPSRELVDGILVLCSGLLLLSPGVLTDVVGLLGLLPPTRMMVRKLILRKLESSLSISTFAPPTQGPASKKEHFEYTQRKQHTWGGAPSGVPKYAEKNDRSDGPALQ